MSALINITAFSLLILCTYYDIRFKKLPVFILVIFAIIIIIINGLEDSLFSRAVFFRIIPGTVFLMLALMTRQAVGYGDGIIIILLGLSLGSKRCITVVFIGLVLSSVFSLYILLLKKGSRQTRLPFVPFLLIAMGVELIETNFFKIEQYIQVVFAR